MKKNTIPLKSLEKKINNFLALDEETQHTYISQLLFLLKEKMETQSPKSIKFSSIHIQKLYHFLTDYCENELILEIPFEDLKKLLGYNEKSYHRIWEFNHRIILPAIQEIEKKTIYKIEAKCANGMICFSLF